MQAFVALLFASSALAARSMMATEEPEWTIESFTRSCDAQDSQCVYTFDIDTYTAPATPCRIAVAGSPASRASTSGQCGDFSVSSNWSGQFGAGNGFTTFAVTNGAQIIYPAYSDSEVKPDTAVSPDKSYQPANLY